MAQGPRAGFRLVIESTPPGATVELDGVPRGQTPLVIPQVSRGGHAVRLRLAGHRDLIRGIRVEGDQTERFTLQPEGGGEHPLTIESEPPGAAVFEGENFLGNTPLFVGIRPAGRYTFTLRSIGYEERREVVDLQGPRTLRVRLQPVGPRLLRLTVSCPQPGNVFLDGQYTGQVGETPLSFWTAPGPHELRVVREGQLDWVQALDVHSDQSFEVPIGTAVYPPSGYSGTMAPYAPADPFRHPTGGAPGPVTGPPTRAHTGSSAYPSALAYGPPASAPRKGFRWLAFALSGGALVLVLIALGTAAAVLLRGGGSSVAEPTPAGPAVAPTGPQTLTLYIGSDPETLDPALMIDVVSITTAYQLMEGLTLNDPATLAPRPGLARDWKVSGDGKTYTFTLRDDLKWSNGDPLTADDFVYAWRRALSPTIDDGYPSPYAYQLYPIRGAQDFNAGKLTDPNQLGVKATDKKTLVVTLENPTPYFLSLTAFPTLFPVNRNVVERNPKDWATPGRMVVNGPFTLAELVRGDHLTLAKNPSYWNARNVRLERVTLVSGISSGKALERYEAGEVDWLRVFPPASIEKYRNNPELHIVPGLSTTYLKFNVTRPPLDKPQVRRALLLALDRGRIVQQATNGTEQPASSFVPPGITGYQPARLPDPNPAEAKRLLAEAGFPDGKGLPRLQFLSTDTDENETIFDLLRDMWRTNLGLEIEHITMEYGQLVRNLQALNYNIARDGWSADYPDPNTFLNLFVTGGGNNNTGWSNKQYDGLIDQAAKTTDAARRLTLLQQAEKLLVTDEVPVVPLYHYANIYLVKPDVRGVAFNLLDFYDLRPVYRVR